MQMKIGVKRDVEEAEMKRGESKEESGEQRGESGGKPDSLLQTDCAGVQPAGKCCLQSRLSAIEAICD